MIENRVSNSFELIAISWDFLRGPVGAEQPATLTMPVTRVSAMDHSSIRSTSGGYPVTPDCYLIWDSILLDTLHTFSSAWSHLVRPKKGTVLSKSKDGKCSLFKLESHTLWLAAYIANPKSGQPGLQCSGYLGSRRRNSHFWCDLYSFISTRSLRIF